MSLALSTLLFEWRRYMAAVMALALSGLLVLAMTGVFIGIGKGFTAAIERSRADVIVMQPGATQVFGGSMALPRRFIPLVYNNPEVVEVRALEINGGSLQSISQVDATMSQAERARQGAPRSSQVLVNVIDTTPGSVTIPVDYSDELVEALRQPFTIAVDETALTTLGVKLGERAIYNGQTVTVVGILRGYPNMMQPTIVMSRDSLRMLGQSWGETMGGPLMVKLRNPARGAQVAAELNEISNGRWKAWTRQELAEANAMSIFEESFLVIIIGGCVVLGTIIGVAITWQTLRGAIMANIKEFASLRALGVGMGSLRRIVMELSFWVGIVGVGAAIFLTWLISLLALTNGIIIALPPILLIIVGGGLIAIAMMSGMLSMGVLKKSQPADLLR